MKAIRVLANVGMIAMLAMNLTACGKKKNGSAPVATPPPAANNATCTKQANGQFVISGTSTPCTVTCPADNKWTDPSTGTVYNCTAGQPVGTQLPPPNNSGNWGNGFQYGGCSMYEYQYGIPYIPIYLHEYGQYMCVRYDLVYGQHTQPNYGHYGYQYYNAYPPYTGPGCNNSISVGGSLGPNANGQLNLCF